ncbi:MAG: hypothetical protein U9R06_02480, partial [Patescibacteria group bacterium]|nr:hypothetical protein [Patescibacteria group bacterium]
EIYTIKASDIIRGGRIYLNPGDKIKIKDLFYLSLVCSSNSAAKALVGASQLGEADFIAKMNAKAMELGLESINFIEPTGLHSYNTASAFEIALFAKAAFADEHISAATLSRKYELATLAGKKITIYNTDSLLDIFPQNGIKILGGKTGYTDLAGYCFIGKFIDNNEHELISVILGNKSRKNSFFETRHVVEWAYNNYSWQ